MGGGGVMVYYLVWGLGLMDLMVKATVGGGGGCVNTVPQGGKDVLSKCNKIHFTLILR